MEYWIWLSMIPYIGAVTAKRIIQNFSEPELVYWAGEEELAKVKGITKKQIESILSSRSLEVTKRVMENCARKNIFILNINNMQYPERAKECKDAPIILYYKGTLENMKKTVGIVGARRCTQDAKKQAVEIAEAYTLEEAAIVSGMAKGIDSYAHTACIKAGGYTIAIVGNGLDICYPSEHLKLMDSIAETGLLLSEYPPGTLPTRYNFPRRNRLISAWSDKLIVIAPGKGSGALTTAEYERKYGREVEIIDDKRLKYKSI